MPVEAVAEGVGYGGGGDVLAATVLLAGSAASDRPRRTSVLMVDVHTSLVAS
jgi:hypothetical protein